MTDSETIKHLADWYEYNDGRPSASLVEKLRKIADRLQSEPKPENRDHILRDLESSPEDHVFDATIENEGRQVWQYWYTDENWLNRHSEYFNSAEDALINYKIRVGISKSEASEPGGWEALELPKFMNQITPYLRSPDGREIFGPFSNSEFKAIALKLNQESRPEPSGREDQEEINWMSLGLVPLSFIQWYSGMSEERINNAYKRWKEEKTP